MVLTLEATESRPSTTLLDRRIVDALTAQLGRNLTSFLNDAENLKYGAYSKTLPGVNAADWYLSWRAAANPESSVVSVDLDGPTARSLRNDPRRQRLIELAIAENLGRYGRIPTLDFDTCVESNEPRDRLILTSPGADAEKVAQIVLADAGRPARPALVLETWRTGSAPYWGWASLLLIVMSFGLAPLQVSVWTAVMAAIVLAVVDAVAVLLAYEGGAAIRVVLGGLASVTIVFGFAMTYAFWMIGGKPGIVTPTDPARWVDALLLSLGIASTGGFLDLLPKAPTVRWVAYLEMVAMVSVAGATVYGVGQAVWRALQGFGREQG